MGTGLPGCCPRAPARPAFSPGRTKVTGRKGKDERHVSFVRLERRLLFHSPEWRQLSARAKIFYLYLKAKYNTTNNGALQLHFSELHACLNCGAANPSTARPASFKSQAGSSGQSREGSFGIPTSIASPFAMTNSHSDLVDV
jgi:hypothetical protein